MAYESYQAGGQSLGNKGGSSYPTYASNNDDARAALLGGVGDIERGADKLRDIQAQASDTEGIGASVLADLQRQRETIGRTTTTFDEMEESHSRLDDVLRNMGFNAITNKYLCYLVGFLVLCTLVMVFVLSLTAG